MVLGFGEEGFRVLDCLNSAGIKGEFWKRNELGFNLISETLRKFGEEVSVLDYGGEEISVKNDSGFR